MAWNKYYDEELEVWLYNCTNAVPNAYLNNSSDFFCANPYSATISLNNVYPPTPYQTYYDNNETVSFSTFLQDVDRSYQKNFGKTAIFVYRILNDGSDPSFISDSYDYQGIYDFINQDTTVIAGGKYSEAGTYAMVVTGNGHAGRYKYQGKTNFEYDSEVPENYALSQGIWNVFSDDSLLEHVYEGPSNYNIKINETASGSLSGNVVNGLYVTDVPIFQDFQEMCEWLWEVDMKRDDLQEPKGVIGKNVFELVEINDAELDDLNTFLSLGSIAFEGGLENSIITLKLVTTPDALGPHKSSEAISIVDNWKKMWGIAKSTNGIAGLFSSFFRSAWFEQTFSEYIDPSVVSAYPLTKQFRWYPYTETGWSLKIPEHFTSNNGASFLNKAPYTTLQLWLPYCGFQDIDSSLVVGNTCYLDVIIDFVTGNLMYYLSVDDPNGTDKSLIYTWNGNCSVEMPLTGEDYGRKVSGFLNAGLQTMTSFVTDNPVGLVNSSETGLQAATNNYYRNKGNTTGNNGFTGIQYPYIVLSYPKLHVPSNYNHVNGRPLNQTRDFSTIQGYTEIDNVIVDIPDASDTEKEMILEKLKSGVIF